MFPFEKYHFYFDEKNRTVVATSTYAGKNVRAKAVADPRDEFDMELGKHLAAARCNLKIAAKRRKRAERKLAEARAILLEARTHYNKMVEYYNDSVDEENLAEDEIQRYL